MTRTRLSLRDLHVLITGGASGIGRLMAFDAASRGARVTIWNLDGTAAESVAAQIRQDLRHVRADAVAINVADEDAVNAQAASTDPVDVVINCAGVVTGRRLLDASSEQIRRTFDVNVLANYWTTRAFLPGMLRRNRGRIVTVASAAALVGVARQTDYSASKFAAFGFMESLRAELREDPACEVTTLVVCPYYIDTGMFDGVTTKFPRLLPILHEDDVSRRIIDAIERGRQQLIMPPLVRVMPLVRILPTRVQDAIVDFFGINRTMSGFTGRTRGKIRHDSPT